MKFTPQNWVGAPDRLILLPGGRTGFAEVKAPGQAPRPLQLARHRQLRRLGYYVAVLDRPGDVSRILDEIEGVDRLLDEIEEWTESIDGVDKLPDEKGGDTKNG